MCIRDRSKAEESTKCLHLDWFTSCKEKKKRKFLFTIPIEESMVRKFNQNMYDFKSQGRADSDSD